MTPPRPPAHPHHPSDRARRVRPRPPPPRPPDRRRHGASVEWLSPYCRVPAVWCLNGGSRLRTPSWICCGLLSTRRREKDREMSRTHPPKNNRFGDGVVAPTAHAADTDGRAILLANHPPGAHAPDRACGRCLRTLSISGSALRRGTRFGKCEV